MKEKKVGHLKRSIAQAIGYPDGSIFLTEAKAEHIQKEHKEVHDVETFVKSVVAHFNKIYAGKNRTLLLVVAARQHCAYVELLKSKGKYRVNTAFPFNGKEFLKDKELLWETLDSQTSTPRLEGIVRGNRNSKPWIASRRGYDKSSTAKQSKKSTNYKSAVVTALLLMATALVLIQESKP